MVNLQATFGALVRLNRFFLGPEESGQHASSPAPLSCKLALPVRYCEQALLRSLTTGRIRDGCCL